MSLQPYENYEKISKNFTEMCSMTETNSEHITALISLVKSQNKSLQSLQSQVYKLQGRLGSEDTESRDAQCSDTEEDEEKTNVKVSEVFCDLCEDRHTALYHCKDCSENLCETIAGIHKKGKATKGHLVLLLSDIEKEPDVDGSYEVPIYKEVSKWNPSGNTDESKVSISNGELSNILFSRKGEIYLADLTNRIPTVFTKSGNYVRQIYNKSSQFCAELKYGSMRLNSLDSLAIVYSDYVYWIKNIFDSNAVLIKCTKPTNVSSVITSGINYGDINKDTVVKISENKVYVFSQNGEIKVQFPINLHTDLKTPICIFVQVSPKGELFIVDMANHIVKVFSEEGKFIRCIGRPSKHVFKRQDSVNQYNTELDNGELHFFPNGIYTPSIQFTDNGNVYIQDKTRIQVFSEQGNFLYKVCECPINYLLTGFAVSPVTGDVAVINHKYGTGTYNIHVLEVTGKYTRKPKETHFSLNTTLVQDSEILKDAKVSSVTFPISIKRDANDNLFTRTLYFPQPIPVKQAIHEVEEYFRKKITKEEFNEVRSVCNFSSVQGELRGDYMNWDACKKAKVIRGYFLGGEIIDELRADGGNLFIHITDCFVRLK